MKQSKGPEQGAIDSPLGRALTEQQRRTIEKVVKTPAFRQMRDALKNVLPKLPGQEN